MKAHNFLNVAGIFGAFAAVGALGEWANNRECRLGGAIAGSAAVYFLLMLFLALLVPFDEWYTLKRAPSWVRWGLGIALVVGWLYLTATAAPRVAAAFGCGEID